jgi:uncharacterized damage-inducible protein DinB
MVQFPEPTVPAASRAEVFLRYLDYFRAQAIEKVTALPEAEARASRLPTGWTPLELLVHLTAMERRWIEWRFEGRALPDPWVDRPAGRWQVPADATVADVVAALTERAAYTRGFIEATDLDTVGVPGPGWPEPATLERVLFHMLQEYARHLGHLDIVTELAGGAVGE